MAALTEVAAVAKLPGQVATPKFSPESGTNASMARVTITCETTGATIRYTLDNTSPSATKEM